MLISFFVILLIEARGASARGNWRYLDLLAAVFFADYLLIEGAIAALFANREGNQSHLLCQQVIFCPKKKKTSGRAYLYTHSRFSDEAAAISHPICELP